MVQGVVVQMTAAVGTPSLLDIAIDNLDGSLDDSATYNSTAGDYNYNLSNGNTLELAQEYITLMMSFDMTYLI